MTFIQEAILAGQGVFAIVTGQRNAPRYFDLTLKGVAGSLIAFLLITAINAFMPILAEDGARALSASQSIIFSILLYALQVGIAAVVLNIFGRLDALVPFIVIDNWSSVYLVIVLVVLTLLQVEPTFIIFAIGIATLLVLINIARLALTLSTSQIVIFIVCQIVGSIVGLAIFSPFGPPAAGA